MSSAFDSDPTAPIANSWESTSKLAFSVPFTKFQHPTDDYKTATDLLLEIFAGDSHIKKELVKSIPHLLGWGDFGPDELKYLAWKASSRK